MLHFSGTDHKAAIITLTFKSFRRGAGMWKFSDNLLDDEFFVETLSRYIQSYYDSLIEENVHSNNMIWDLIKIGIRDECIAYVRNKKVADISCELNAKIKEFNDILTKNPHNKEALKTYINLISKKEIAELSKARGAILRARSKYIDEAEK